jgi:hypothetical protein
MDELERRLRAAMTARSEPPPPGLLAAVRRRHTRHVRRAGAGGVAAVAAIALAFTPVTHALRAGVGSITSGSGSAGSGAGPAGPGSGAARSAPAARPTAVPGTALRDCQTENNGELGSNWQAQSLHVGPVWLVYAQLKDTWPSSRRVSGGFMPHLKNGKLAPAAGVIIAVPNGTTAEVSATPAARQHFRFLTDLYGNAGRYTLRDGSPGLTIAGCPASPVGTGIPESYAAGLTLYWVIYITDLRHCIPLEVRQLPAGKLVRVTVSTAGGTCR